MPRRNDLKKILLIGSGPIQIGQACEFDYSGTQAIKALKEEGLRVVLVNSNPATIMTDPELADRVYIEPLTVPVLEAIIRKEKPDAVLPTMGGQTALNLTLDLHRAGILSRYGVEILGAKPEVIHRAEDRDEFRRTMDSIGVESAKSQTITSMRDAEDVLGRFGLPLVLRPSFTLGGEGGGIVHTREDFFSKLERALFLSPTSSCLVEECLLGWKEFELEVVRDRADNVVIVCSIENFDPMGVHTGDSITVAPAQTLTDREYQNLRNQALKIIRAIGVETGGSNIQFAINPQDGRVIVIEMNPRVSRSSALASKATGFPIARVAAKLAIGYTLDELKNDITGTTPAAFEPAIDYVVTKIPRFDFDKFPNSDRTLGTQMKSVGEVMALGRSFEEALMKAVASLGKNEPWTGAMDAWREWSGGDLFVFLSPRIARPTPERLNTIFKLFVGVPDTVSRTDLVETTAKVTFIDPWFLDRIYGITALVRETLGIGTAPPEGLKSRTILLTDLNAKKIRQLKSAGILDAWIASALGVSEHDVRLYRERLGVLPGVNAVDTCAGEFVARTPFFYSSYLATQVESARADLVRKSRGKVMILGSGPNRIGQGIEFDYSCVHAAMALRAAGYETLMVNCNPETVSTDFDISDRLYFEPLTVEHVIEIARIENPMGVIVQLGGQTPLKLARGLQEAGLKILGTSFENIDLTEDRKKFDVLVRDILPYRLRQPESRIAHTRREAVAQADSLGFPLLVRPSYVLGGMGMKIVRSAAEFESVVDAALRAGEGHPLLIDRFLDRATEVDVDALCDGEMTLIAGVMEHIEEAGIHSGDSASCLPPWNLSRNIVDRIRTYTRILGRKCGVRGLMNVQYAVVGDEIYLIEVNPRASRTAPFISKATGFPIIKIATRLMMGERLADLGFDRDFDSGLKTYHVKGPVFPFHKFAGVDPVLGPEMKSTGEVMGRSKNFAIAYAKAMEAAGQRLPHKGKIFMSIRNEDKAEALALAEQFSWLGFTLVATRGTAQFLRENGQRAETVLKLSERGAKWAQPSASGTPENGIGTEPRMQHHSDQGKISGGPRADTQGDSALTAPDDCVTAIRRGEYALVINTVSDGVAVQDGYEIRRAALERKIPYSTVLANAWAMLSAIEKLQDETLEVEALGAVNAPD